MTYEEVRDEYEALFSIFMSYTPNEAGSIIYASKLADIEEAYPEWVEQIENGG